MRILVLVINWYSSSPWINMILNLLYQYLWSAKNIYFIIWRCWYYNFQNLFNMYICVWRYKLIKMYYWIKKLIKIIIASLYKVLSIYLVITRLLTLSYFVTMSRFSDDFFFFFTFESIYYKRYIFMRYLKCEFL